RASGSENSCNLGIRQCATENFHFVDPPREIEIMRPSRIVGAATDKEILRGIHRYARGKCGNDNSVSVKLRHSTIVSQGNVVPLVERRNERRVNDAFLNHPGQLVELED